MSEVDSGAKGKKKASECHCNQCENNAATAMKNSRGRQKESGRAKIELPFRLPEPVRPVAPELAGVKSPQTVRGGWDNVVSQCGSESLRLAGTMIVHHCSLRCTIIRDQERQYEGQSNARRNETKF